VLGCSILSAPAQFQEDVSVQGVSGGVSSGGPYAVYGTLGQTTAGIATSDTHAVRTGFSAMLTTAPVTPFLATNLLANRILTLGVADLLRGASDDDNDTVSLLACGASSVQHGVITSSPEFLSYTPPAGFEGVDAFDYLVVDAGGDTARGVITVTVAPDQEYTLHTLYSAKVVNGSFQAVFVGLPGQVYTVETSPALLPARWRKLRNITLGAASDPPGYGTAVFTDLLGAEPVQFYRVVYPAY
jgi:hypothetical protein